MGDLSPSLGQPVHAYAAEVTGVLLLFGCSPPTVAALIQLQRQIYPAWVKYVFLTHGHYFEQRRHRDYIPVLLADYFSTLHVLAAVLESHIRPDEWPGQFADIVLYSIDDGRCL